MLEFACIVIERVMPTPEALHQFVVSPRLSSSSQLDASDCRLQYEIVRSSSIIEKQTDILIALEVPIQSAVADNPRGTTLSVHSRAMRALKTIQGAATYYEGKINHSNGGRETGDIMKLISAEVERDGVHLDSIRETEAPL
jgi:hypothetical protein